MSGTFRKGVAARAMVAALLTVAAAGCESVATMPGAVPSAIKISAETQPKINDGRMVFEDFDHYGRFLEHVIDAPPADLVDLERQYDGFESLRAYVDGGEWSEETARRGGGSEEPTGNEAEALSRDGITRSDLAVGDGLLTTLNRRGEVQVADRVIKFTRDNVYDVGVEDLAALNEKVPALSSPAPTEADSRFQVHPVETTETEVTEQPVYSRSTPGGPSLNVVHASGGSNYRLRASSYVTNAYFYSESGVNTTWQRRKRFLFTYWANSWQPGTLKHDYNVTYTVGLFPGVNFGPVVGSQSQTGTDRIHRTLMWRVGISPVHTFIRARGGTKHAVSNPTLNTTVGTHF